MIEVIYHQHFLHYCSFYIAATCHADEYNLQMGWKEIKYIWCTRDTQRVWRKRLGWISNQRSSDLKTVLVWRGRLLPLLWFTTISTLSDTEKDKYPLHRFLVRTQDSDQWFSGNIEYVIHVCVYVTNQS